MNTVLKTAPTIEEAVNLGLKELGITRDQATIEVIQEEASGFLGLIGKKDAVVRVGIREDEEDISSFVKDILYDEPEIEAKETKPEMVKKVEDIKESIDEATEKVEEAKETIVPEVEDVIEDTKENTEELVEKTEKTESHKKSPRFEKEIWDNDRLVAKAEEFVSKIVDKMDIDYTVDVNLIDNMMNIVVETKDPADLGIVIGSRGSTLDAIQHLVSIVINNHTEQYLRVIVDANGYRQNRIEKIRAITRRNADQVKRSGRDYRMDYMNPAERRIVHMTLQDDEEVVTRSEGLEPRRRVIIYKKD